MPHIKTYLCHSAGRVEWLIVGSHNLSKAAFGWFTSTAKAALKILSWELSLVFLPASRASSRLGFTLSRQSQQQQLSATQRAEPMKHFEVICPYENDKGRWSLRSVESSSAHALSSNAQRAGFMQSQALWCRSRVIRAP